MEELVRQIDGREVRITNPEKVLWPEPLITKLAYVDYLPGPFTRTWTGFCSTRSPGNGS